MAYTGKYRAGPVFLFNKQKGQENKRKKRIEKNRMETKKEGLFEGLCHKEEQGAKNSTSQAAF